LTSLLSVPTPKLYFCHGDEFTIQFMMILEDLCDLNRGEPNGLRTAIVIGGACELGATLGFDLSDASVVATSLGSFHAATIVNNARVRYLAMRDKVWPHAGERERTVWRIRILTGARERLLVW
jgi:hypothetical protein